MATIKEKIQADFITAMKAKNEVEKSALSSIKAKITEGEKANGNKELSNDDVVKIINKGIKQREESAKIYTEAGRGELATKELLELNVLMNYMPAQMTETEIEVAIREIIAGIDHGGNMNKLVGQTMGVFNRNYQGRADNKLVSEIIKRAAGV
jgi:uncharacterized protein